MLFRSCGVSEEKMIKKLVAMLIWNMDDLPSDKFDRLHDFNVKYLGRLDFETV